MSAPPLQPHPFSVRPRGVWFLAACTVALLASSTASSDRDAPLYEASAASARPAAQPGPLPAPPLAAEIAGRLRAVASDGRWTYVAHHSRVLVLDPERVAGGRPKTATTPSGAPITALAARPGWLVALADGLRIFALDPTAATAPRLVAHLPLRRAAQDVTWSGDVAWLPSGDLVQRVDLSDPTHPRALHAWRPSASSAAHAAPRVRDLVSFAEGALILLSANALDPNDDMLGEALLLRDDPAGEPRVVARDPLPRCCPMQGVVLHDDGDDPTASDPRAIVVDTRGASWLELRPAAEGEPARLRVDPLPLPGGLRSPVDLAWTADGLWWADDESVRLIDPADAASLSPSLRLPTSARRDAVRLQPVGRRLLVATDAQLRWADAAPRLLAGPATDAWPVAQLAPGADTLWLRGEDRTLRWTPLAAPGTQHVATGEVPEPIIDLAADQDRVYVVYYGAIRYLRHDGDRHLTRQPVILPHDAGNRTNDAPRLLDAADGILAATVDDDRDRVVRMDAPSAREGLLYHYHGPGPTAVGIEGERLYVLCATRSGGPCTLATHDLRDRSGALDPAPLPLSAGAPIAPTIGHAGGYVMLGLGAEVALAHVPPAAGAAPVLLGQLDLPGPVLEIAMDVGRAEDDGRPLPAGAAWVLSDGGRHLSWLDLADPSVPRERARIRIASDASSLRARGGRAWLVSDGAVLVFDRPGTAPSERPPPARETPAPVPAMPLSLPWLSVAP